MFESIVNFFKKIGKQEKEQVKSKDAAKERLHLVLMQDRANVSADFLDLMKQEIIEVIKKYIDVDENAIDVRLTNKANTDGTTGAPALYANIPIMSIKEDVKSGMARQNDCAKLNNEEEIQPNVENNQEEVECDIEDKKEVEQNNEEVLEETREQVNNEVDNKEKKQDQMQIQSETEKESELEDTANK